MRRNLLANANDFANEIANILSSLRKFLANGSLRRDSLAIANAISATLAPRACDSCMDVVCLSLSGLAVPVMCMD